MLMLRNPSCKWLVNFLILQLHLCTLALEDVFNHLALSRNQRGHRYLRYSPSHQIKTDPWRYLHRKTANSIRHLDVAALLCDRDAIGNVLSLFIVMIVPLTCVCGSKLPVIEQQSTRLDLIGVGTHMFVMCYSFNWRSRTWNAISSLSISNSTYLQMNLPLESIVLIVPFIYVRYYVSVSVYKETMYYLIEHVHTNIQPFIAHIYFLTW